MNKILVTFLVAFSMLSVLTAQKPQAVDTLKYKKVSDILYRNASELTNDEYAMKNCRLDVYFPLNKADFATIVWIHGGSLTGGKKELPSLLTGQGFAVVSIEYRRNPKVNCPVYIEDAAAAVAWVFKNIASYGGSPDKIFLSGHSAGGYLGLMVGMDKKWLAAFDVDASRIAGLLPLSPQVITHFKIREERGLDEKQPVIDAFAPIFHVRSNLPPIITITGDRELEMLGRYEENAYFVRMLKINGHTRVSLYELDGFSHGGMKEPGLLLMVKELKKILK